MDYDARHLRSAITEMAWRLPDLQVGTHNALLRAGGDVERLLLLHHQLSDALYGQPEA